MEDLKLRLVNIKSRNPDVKTFRFKLNKNIHYKPGQYLLFTLNIKGEDLSKPFSISSSPTEKGFIEFTKKLTGSDFSNALNSMALREYYTMRAPMGSFTFEGEYEKAAFLSGGIGITPIRSIIKYATDTNLSSDLVLLYSSRTPEYLIFKDDFESMKEKNKNLKIVYTLTDTDEKVAGCRNGRIDEKMVKEELPDYMERRFYTCGPPGMVESMRSLLTDRLGVPKSNIIIENFTGY